MIAAFYWVCILVEKMKVVVSFKVFLIDGKLGLLDGFLLADIEERIVWIQITFYKKKMIPSFKGRGRNQNSSDIILLFIACEGIPYLFKQSVEELFSA